LPNERYLIPEALPASEPDYGIWPEDAIRFRFSYQLLPAGLIPRFIVQAHRNLTDKPTRWRTGVVLGAAQSRVLVRGDLDRKRLDISVAGPQGLRRSALNIVLDDLDEVHARYAELGGKPLVPLTDQPELDVSYQHLLRLEQRYGLDHEFDPEDADRPYTVRELLEGVRRDPSAKVEEHFAAKRYHIETGDHAQVTVVDGGIRRSGGENGQQSGTSKPEDTTPSTGASWRWFSAACGLGAILVAIVLLLLPPRWSVYVGGLLGLGLLVTVMVWQRNPRNFYRRWLGYVLPAGLLMNAAGFALEGYASGSPLTAWFHWDGTVSWTFNLAWAGIVGLLVWGDLKQSG
jgi:C-terminal of Roc, COR, domain